MPRQRSIDQSGHKSVGRDLVLAEFERSRFHQPDDSPLRGRVRCTIHRAVASLGGGGHNDPSAPSPYHSGGESTDGVRGSREVDINLNMPVGIFHLKQRPEGLNPRIRKKNVNSSEVMLDL